MAVSETELNEALNRAALLMSPEGQRKIEFAGRQNRNNYDEDGNYYQPSGSQGMGRNMSSYTSQKQMTESRLPKAIMDSIRSNPLDNVQSEYSTSGSILDNLDYSPAPKRVEPIQESYYSPNTMTSSQPVYGAQPMYQHPQQYVPQPIGIDYNYIANFNELLKLREKTDCIIVYDEIFSALQKNTTINKDVLDFLSQMRKRRIICLTTAQEWAEIPLTWRRYCRYQIDCRLIRLPFIKGILIKVFKDAENMRWSNEDQEHIAPLLETTITHTQKWLADSYDTFEQIHNNLSETGYFIRSSPEEEASPPQEEEKESIEILTIDDDFWTSSERKEILK